MAEPMTEEQADRKQLATLASRRTPVWVGMLIGGLGIGVGFGSSTRGATIAGAVCITGGLLAIERNQRLDPMLRELRRLQAEVARLGGRQDQG